MNTDPTGRNEREKKVTTLATIADYYIADLSLKNRSPDTIACNRGWLRRFGEFLTARGHSLLYKDLTSEDARAYIADLQARDQRWKGHPHMPPQEIYPQGGALSPNTIAQAARVLRGFGNWLKRNGFRNPFDRLEVPRVPKKLIDPLKPEEVAQLINSINPNTDQGGRNYALVVLLLDTGLRASEAAALQVAHMDMQRRIIKVMGKGEKERLVPFGQRASQALVRYMTVFRPKPANAVAEACVFLSVDGHAMTYNGIHQIFKRLRARSGIARLHAHLLRHTFAVNYLMNGGDIVTLQMILGHETLEITRKYLHLSKQHIMVQHQSFSPMDRMELGDGRRRFSHRTMPADP